MHDGTLELLHRATDLVAEGGLTLLVVHLSPEETMAAGGSSSCCVTVGHFDCEIGLIGWVKDENGEFLEVDILYLR